MRMIPLINTQDVGELAMIKSLFDGNRIPYIVHDEHVNSLYPGVASLVSRVLVEESEWVRAETLLSRLRLAVREAEAPVQPFQG